MTKAEELLRIAGNNNLSIAEADAIVNGLDLPAFREAVKLRTKFMSLVGPDDPDLDAYSKACLEAAQYLAEGGR